jgi:hydrogenase nickel incorporation protein HypA/HybF
MHELAITQSVVDLVAERTKGRRVVAVHVRVGRLSGVVADSMAFCFDLATAGTALAGARLDIEETPARVVCRTCRSEQELPDALLLCACGSADVDVLDGDDLRVVSVELEKEPTCA